MIARDEEEHLGRCLASVKGHVDEMIVVDTGSTDRTVEIAREFGAQVYSFAWCDDFAAARNESLRHATRDWILVLDADEEIAPESAPRLHAAIAEARAHGLKTVQISLRDIDANGNIGSVFRQYKLWECDARIRYTGKIHEHINAVLPAYDAGLMANHYGYAACAPEVRKKKLARNIRLLERELKSRPEDIHTLYHLTKEYYQSGDYSRTIELVQRQEQIYARNRQEPPAELCRLKAMATCGKGDFVAALDVCRLALEHFPDHIDFYFVQAEAFRQLERWDEVVVSLTRYQRLLRRFRRGEILQNELTVLTAGRAGEAAILLAWAHLQSANFGGFRRWLVQACREGRQSEAAGLLRDVASNLPPDEFARISQEMTLERVEDGNVDE